jgi:hypothetical protein
MPETRIFLFLLSREMLHVEAVAYDSAYGQTRHGFGSFVCHRDSAFCFEISGAARRAEIQWEGKTDGREAGAPVMVEMMAMNLKLNHSLRKKGLGALILVN